MAAFHKRYDVLVAGGGVAGVAAALAEARMGLSTALVEKTVLPGGLATGGQIIVYLPLCDGAGTQVTFGLAEELLHAALKYGPGDIPQGWRRPQPKSGHHRLSAPFCAASFVLALDELIERAGVDVWYDTLICGSVVDGDRLTAIEVENKSGRGRLQARCFVDATGDADVAFHAGAPCIEQDNRLSLWAVEASVDAARRAVESGSGEPLNRGVRVGATNRVEGHPEGLRTLFGTRGRDVTDFVREGRRLLREHYARRQAEAGRRNVYPIALPTMAQFRTTRRIDGLATLSDGMFAHCFDDSVGLVANWWRAAEVWQVPYRTLLPRKVRGLLAAGRCISAAGEAWEVMRVIQAAAHTGEIAGVAAALAVRGDTTPDALDVARLRAELAPRGVRFAREDGPARSCGG